MTFALSMWLRSDNAAKICCLQWGTHTQIHSQIEYTQRHTHKHTHIIDTAICSIYK